LQLLGLSVWLEPNLTAVADAMAAGERAHTIPYRIGLVAREIGATAV
jgi:hypothetical protein